MLLFDVLHESAEFIAYLCVLQQVQAVLVARFPQPFLQPFFCICPSECAAVREFIRASECDSSSINSTTVSNDFIMDILVPTVDRIFQEYSLVDPVSCAHHHHRLCLCTGTQYSWQYHVTEIQVHNINNNTPHSEECPQTLRDLFEKAANPQLISVGICWQGDMQEDRDVWSQIEDWTKTNQGTLQTLCT